MPMPMPVLIPMQKSKYLFYQKVGGFIIEQVDIDADTDVDAEK